MVTQEKSVKRGLSVGEKIIEVAKRYGPIKSIYDCGSRDALDGLELLDRLEAESLHIFECNPASAGVCRSNAASHPKSACVKVNEVAVSDKIGVATFYPIDTENTVTPHEDGNPGASSMFKANPEYPNEKYVQREITVPTTTLDAYAKENVACDLLWMDLQGAELMALKGGTDSLKTLKIIHTEISFREMYLGQPLFWEIDKFLQPNFALVDLDLGRWPKVLWLYKILKRGPWVGNAIYVNRNLL